MKLYLFPILTLLFSASYLNANISIATTTLPNGTVNTPYSAAINAKNGCSPASWAISSGTLPAGISMKVSTKQLSLSLTGSPTTAATYSFTVEVTGCRGISAAMSYTVTIQPAANHVVDLSWQGSTSSGVAGYNMYRSPDGTTWQKLNTSLVTSTLYSDANVTDGSTYYYAATTVDSNGAESDKSIPVEISVP